MRNIALPPRRPTIRTQVTSRRRMTRMLPILPERRILMLAIAYRSPMRTLAILTISLRRRTPTPGMT